MSNLRLRLKENTRDLHDQVEATAFMSRLLRDDLTPADYARTMRALHAVYTPLERELGRTAGLTEVLPDLPERLKVGSLEKDLRAMPDLGGARPIGPLDVAPFASVAEALGVLYVLEGSTMGGRLIAAKLKTRPFVAPGSLHFFEHYGRDAARYWQTFTKALENVPPADWDAVVAGARRTFALFIAAAG